MDSSRKTSGATSTPINIIDLKPGMENVSVRVRVISVTPPKTIETKKGTRTISNAIVGDATGRVEAVLWGERVTALHENDVVEIRGAWVTEYKGKVQLNIGKSTVVEKAPSDSVPEEIPENEPRATGAQRSFRPQRRGFQKRGRKGGTYGE
jgi:replication factor A1